ncbi:uncharacterized protein LOC108417209 isoform X1 [Pygocentrus nattereri]|uniref:uncharacterized protein LOC108417209 isoform X1 n=1 Tax=Pygocentrus nattereri TaxID=42514 RepID=UPI001891A32E|nr:uncharacterized protein LOC108417209 isoform X1 [Pygocentrus nattereri]
MERSSAVLITLMCVLISSISGIVVEMRVKPGDDVTIYCDFTWKSGFKIVWVIKPSHEHQPPLFHLTEDSTLPHYSRVWNNSKATYDLLVKNITGSELGLYYCALHETKFFRNENGDGLIEDFHHDGNRTTFVSFLDTTVPSANLSETPSTPPVSDCSVCWKLLVSVCPVCVLLSSVVSSIGVYCICTTRTKADHEADQQRNISMRKHDEVGDDVCSALLDVPSGDGKRLKKRTAERFDFCTYSQVQFEKM